VGRDFRPYRTVPLINSLLRLTCPACPPRFFPVEVVSTFGGVCSGRSLDGGIDELPEFMPNRDAAPCSPSPALPHASDRLPVASGWSPIALRENSAEPKAATRTPAQRASSRQEAQVVFREIAALRRYRKFREILKVQFSSCERLLAARPDFRGALIRQLTASLADGMLPQQLSYWTNFDLLCGQTRQRLPSRARDTSRSPPLWLGTRWRAAHAIPRDRLSCRLPPDLPLSSAEPPVI